MTEYCCVEFESAVANKTIIDETNIPMWNAPTKLGGWWFSQREYDPYQEAYEYRNIIAPIKFCPWCMHPIIYDDN